MMLAPRYYEPDKVLKRLTSLWTKERLHDYIYILYNVFIEIPNLFTDDKKVK